MSAHRTSIEHPSNLLEYRVLDSQGVTQLIRLRRIFDFPSRTLKFWTGKGIVSLVDREMPRQVVLVRLWCTGRFAALFCIPRGRLPRDRLPLAFPPRRVCPCIRLCGSLRQQCSLSAFRKLKRAFAMATVTTTQRRWRRRWWYAGALSSVVVGQLAPVFVRFLSSTLYSLLPAHEYSSNVVYPGSFVSFWSKATKSEPHSNAEETNA